MKMARKILYKSFANVLQELDYDKQMYILKIYYLNKFIS